MHVALDIIVFTSLMTNLISFIITNRSAPRLAAHRFGHVHSPLCVAASVAHRPCRFAVCRVCVQTFDWLTQIFRHDDSIGSPSSVVGSHRIYATVHCDSARVRFCFSGAKGTEFFHLFVLLPADSRQSVFAPIFCSFRARACVCEWQMQRQKFLLIVGILHPLKAAAHSRRSDAFHFNNVRES